MSLVRGLHSDAHMRPLRVVEVDYSLQDRLAFRPRGDCHFVKPFYLQDAIGPFRNGILKGITALRHADAHATLSEFRDILVAAVLTAPVGVMNEHSRRSVVYRRQCHPEGFQRICRF